MTTPMTAFDGLCALAAKGKPFSKAEVIPTYAREEITELYGTGHRFKKTMEVRHPAGDGLIAVDLQLRIICGLDGSLFLDTRADWTSGGVKHVSQATCRGLTLELVEKFQASNAPTELEQLLLQSECEASWVQAYPGCPRDLTRSANIACGAHHQAVITALRERTPMACMLRHTDFGRIDPHELVTLRDWAEQTLSPVA